MEPTRVQFSAEDLQDSPPELATFLPAAAVEEPFTFDELEPPVLISKPGVPVSFGIKVQHGRYIGWAPETTPGIAPSPEDMRLFFQHPGPEDYQARYIRDHPEVVYPRLPVPDGTHADQGIEGAPVRHRVSRTIVAWRLGIISWFGTLGVLTDVQGAGGAITYLFCSLVALAILPWLLGLFWRR